MIGTVFQAILDKLNDDTTLQGYFVGSTFFAFRAKMVAPSVIPAITLMENTEKSTTRAGYSGSKVRENSATIQVDVWVSSADESFPCTGEDTDLIAERIDEVLLDGTTPVTGTTSWQKSGSSQQHENDERIWHNALRYSFRYSALDS